MYPRVCAPCCLCYHLFDLSIPSILSFPVYFLHSRVLLFAFDVQLAAKTRSFQIGKEP
jgi:hypothetical protein